MTAEIKLRMASFKESEIKVYDENINKYSGKAVEVIYSNSQHLLKREKILSEIKKLKGQNDTEYRCKRQPI